MGLFGKKKEAKEQKPIEEVMAQNVFGKTLLNRTGANQKRKRSYMTK